MIYSVNLEEIAGRIKYIELRKYVTDLGWRAYTGKVADGLEIYQKFYNDHLYQIKIPCDKEFADYAEAIYYACKTIAFTEEKSEEQLILELLNPMSDILRVRHISDDVENGSILFEDAISLYENSKKMLLNAALDLVHYKKIYKGRTPDDISEFINKCRYGQTEIGSYVISLVCPFMSLNNGSVQQLSIFGEKDVLAHSLTRRATKKVIESINLVSHIIEKGENLADLVEDSEKAISVSFLESLSNLNLCKENSSVEISAKWAPTITMNRAEEDKVLLTHDYYLPIKAVVDKYKKDDEKSTVILEGRISKLTAAPNIEDRKEGQAQLVYIDENSKASKIMLLLRKEEYDTAIQAHSAGKTIRASGVFLDKKKTMTDVALEILG